MEISENIAIIVKKSCDICKFCDVDDGDDTLFCTKYDNKVDDKFVCNEFELCKEVMSDTFFDIKQIIDHEDEI